MAAALTDIIPEGDIVDWTRQFVRYPSPQTDLFEAEPAVLGFIEECVAPLVADLGMPYRRDSMGNLIVEIGPPGTGRGLLLMAYAMTHPASSMNSPFGGELIETADGPAVRGRGVAEQKGSLAAALAAAGAAARDGNLGGSLVFAVSTAGETGRHDAAEAIFGALGHVPPLGIVVIGTSGRISLGNKGRIDVEMEVHGRAAHSSTPWAGTDAIEGARRVLDQLAALEIDAGDHPGLGQATLTPTFIESFPRATHTVQNAVRITLDRRLVPGQDPDAALAEIRAAIGLDEPWRLDISRGAFMYPCEIAADGPLVTAIEAGCSAQGVARPGHFYSNGALDAGYMTLNGCETAMWGPGPMDDWHSDEESVLVRDLVDGAKAYYGLIRACLC